MLFLGAMLLFGKHILAPITLRSLPAEEVDRRLAAFQSTVLGRALLILYLVYPGVSVAVFGIFSCTATSRASYLDADMAITCWDSTHWRYVCAGVVWVFVIPVGVPYFFIRLLRHFKVPEMARLRADNAWLQEAAQLAWTRGLSQSGVKMSALDVDNIGDSHLEALHALFIHGVSVGRAEEIMSGLSSPPGDDELKQSDPEKNGLQDASCIGRAQLRTKATLSSCLSTAKQTHAMPRRAIILQALLTWCRTSGKLALPALEWEVMAAEHAANADHEVYKEENHERDAHPPPQNGWLSWIPSMLRRAEPNATISCKDLPHLQQIALREVGFLFSAYHTATWCARCRACDSARQRSNELPR